VVLVLEEQAAPVVLCYLLSQLEYPEVPVVLAAKEDLAEQVAQEAQVQPAAPVARVGLEALADKVVLADKEDLVEQVAMEQLVIQVEPAAPLFLQIILAVSKFFSITQILLQAVPEDLVDQVD
jgi:hypothetical protein